MRAVEIEVEVDDEQVERADEEQRERQRDRPGPPVVAEHELGIAAQDDDQHDQGPRLPQAEQQDIRNAGVDVKQPGDEPDRVKEDVAPVVEAVEVRDQPVVSGVRRPREVLHRVLGGRGRRA